MRALHPREAASAAVSAHDRRPAMAIVHDAPDARLVVFRLAPGQQLPPHRSPSTVLLSVIGGSGVVSGGEGEQAVADGDVVVFEPNELHGLRATTETFSVLATIAPRPGERNAGTGGA